MSISFTVDDVTPAAAPLPTRPLRSLAPDALLVGGDPETPIVDHEGVHPLLAAVHAAFSEHRSLVLSPDVLWLTIAQGVAQHVRLHAESLRPRLVQHGGRSRLEIEHLGPPPRDAAELACMLETFRAGLAAEVGAGMARLFVCDFSTTTDVERMASEVVLLDAYSPYFDFVGACVCGIPEVTLLGTPDDYRAIRQRVDVLPALELDFWHPSLVHIADALVATAEGRPDLDFWRGVYKPRRAYGWQRIMGWSARLYPYIQDVTRLAQRNPLLALPFDFVRPEPDWEDDFLDSSGIRTIDVPATLSRVLIDIRDRTCTPPARLGFDLEAGVTHVEQDASGNLVPRCGYFLRRHERSIHEAIERMKAEHACEPPAPGGILVRDMSTMGEVVALYEHLSSAVLFDGPRAWRLRRLEVMGEGPYQRLRGTIRLERWTQLMPLLDLPGGRLLCEADGVYVCVRAADVTRDPDAHEVDEITGLQGPACEGWTLDAGLEQIPIVDRRLSDLLFRVLDGGPDVDLPALGTLRDLRDEQRREDERREEERRRAMTPEELELERKDEERRSRRAEERKQRRRT